MKFGEETLAEYVAHYFDKYPEIAAIPVDIISLLFITIFMAVSIIALALNIKAILLINKELRSLDSFRNVSCSRSHDRQS